MLFSFTLYIPKMQYIYNEFKICSSNLTINKYHYYFI